MIGFGSYRSASTASPALASIVAEVTLHPSKGPFCQGKSRNLPCGRRNAAVGRLPSCFGQTNPTIDPSPWPTNATGRLGYASAKRTQRTMIFPQTNPTSANEANLEIIVKTMFEHEQHDAWLLGRTNLRYCAGTLAKRTREADRSPFSPSEPERRATSILAKRTDAGGSVMAAY